MAVFTRLFLTRKEQGWAFYCLVSAVLLLILVESQGRALSKAHLMSALWPDTFVEEANLPFQISALRKALGDDGARWIETLPKHGYRFNALGEFEHD